MDIAYSVNGVPIRLTAERWKHIVNNKPYMESYHEKVLVAVENPTCILRGYAAALIAVLALARGTYLCVVYREVSRDDGFIITAFLSKKLNRGKIIWPKKS